MMWYGKICILVERHVRTVTCAAGQGETKRFIYLFDMQLCVS
jgi:hypothetical protein